MRRDIENSGSLLVLLYIFLMHFYVVVRAKMLKNTHSATLEKTFGTPETKNFLRYDSHFNFLSGEGISGVDQNHTNT
jgi:hypothetical protein